MNLRLNTKKSPADAVRRLARRELGKAADALTRPRGRTESVHAARKHVKKVRALLRLVRKRTGSRFFLSENQSLRGFGRKLSEVRDSQVVLSVLDDLRHTIEQRSTVKALKALHEALTKSFPGAARPDLSAKVALAHSRQLHRLRWQVQRWPLKNLSWEDLRASLARNYRRGHRAMARYKARHTLPNLHEWRKRAKDFWYQLLMLAGLLPCTLRKLIPKVEVLTETQGAILDLDLLRTALDDLGEAFSSMDRHVIQQLIQKRLRKTEGQALKCGGAVFREPPRIFARWLNS